MIKIVSNFDELVSTPFRDGINALCWERELSGDFCDVIQHLDVDTGITTLSDSDLRGLPLSAEGRVAVEFMIADQERLRACDLEPVLDCVNGYEPVSNPGPIPTDVCSFHVDSATVEADTWLCTYFGAPSEGLLNDGAVRRVDIPETRAKLLEAYGGKGRFWILRVPE